MTPRVLKRFIILMAALTVISFLSWEFLGSYFEQLPGDYNTKRGDQLLTAKDYDGALENFNLALQEQPDHRGAVMGRALVFTQTDRLDEALAELDHLIAVLESNLDTDDKTAVGTLAAAYANRGIVNDRQEKYEAALEDYVEALRVDEGAVEGPGVVHKVLYGTERASSVRDRAIYIYEQLQLPEDERLLRIPELDAQQRMHKP